MKNLPSLLLAAALLASSTGIADAAEYVVLRDGTPLHKAPDAAAAIVAEAGKGWILDAGVDDKADAEWHEIYQLDSGDGYFYAYLAYNLPGDNVFVHRNDIRPRKEADAAPAAAPMARPSSSADAPALPTPQESPDDYLSRLAAITVTADDVRLREGPGLHGNVAGKANRGDRFIAFREPISVPDSRSWYRIAYIVRQQEELSVEEASDLFVCSDFARPAPISDRELTRIESSRFGIVRAGRDGCVGLTIDADVMLHAPGDNMHEGPRNILLSAGTPVELYTIPSRSLDGRTWVALWTRLDDRRIRRAGSMPLEELRTLPLEAGRADVDAWLRKYLLFDKVKEDYK